MPDLITLVVPNDALGYLISWGIEAFRPYLENPKDPSSRSLIDVPPDKAGDFLKRGGFYVKTKTLVVDEVPGMTRMIAPNSDSAASFKVASDDNPLVVWIPNAEVAARAESHGFARAPLIDAPEPTREERAAQLMAELAELGIEMPKPPEVAPVPQGTDGGLVPIKAAAEVNSANEQPPHPEDPANG